MIFGCWGVPDERGVYEVEVECSVAADASPEDLHDVHARTVLVELCSSSVKRRRTAFLLSALLFIMTPGIIPAWSACCSTVPLRLSRPILVTFALVEFITAITAPPISPLPFYSSSSSSSLLLPSGVLPHLKRRPVDGPRNPLHHVDPDAANAHHARVLVNGQVRLRVPRRAVRHRRRAENVYRQMPPVWSPGGEAEVFTGPCCSSFHEGLAVVRGREGDEVFGAAEGPHRDVDVDVLYALGVVYGEGLEFLAGLADGKVSQEGVYVVAGVVSKQMSGPVEFVCKVASIVVLVVFRVWLDKAFVEVANAGRV